MDASQIYDLMWRLVQLHRKAFPRMSYFEFYQAFEKHMAQRAIEQSRGNNSEAARVIGFPRTAFVALRRRNGLAVGKAPDEI